MAHGPGFADPCPTLFLVDHRYNADQSPCFSSSTPDQWEDFSNQNIIDAEKQRQNTAALRAILDGVLQSTCADMRKQKECADVALLKRITETRDAKEKLEAHLAKVGTVSDVYMHLCICIYAFMHICICVYVHICIYAYMYMCIYAYLHI